MPADSPYSPSEPSDDNEPLIEGGQAFNFEDALSKYTRYVLESISTQGWDQPASLWALRLNDSPASAPGFAVTFALDHVTDFESFTAQDLIGWRAPDHTVAVALVCECWTYHPDRQEPYLEPPSGYDDSLELRVMHLVMRDGTEVLASQFRDDVLPETVVFGTQLGRVPQMLRRVIDLPSSPKDPLPSIAEVRSRIVPALGVMALSSVHTFAQRKLLAEFAAAAVEIYRDLVRHLGLFEATWEGSLKVARAASVEYDHPQFSDLDLRTILPWVDAPLWALTLEESIPTVQESLHRLTNLLTCGGLDPELYADAVEILTRPTTGY